MGSEYHILLKLPDAVASLIEQSPPPPIEIRFDGLPPGSSELPPPCGELARLHVGESSFRAKLMALPTVVESHKSLDRVGYLKCGHVGQVLVVAEREDELPKGTELSDGITPPCAQIRERKWRRRPVRDRKEVEQVVVELEANIKGSLPKPEYELVEVDVEVTDDDESIFGEESEAEAMDVDDDSSKRRGNDSTGEMSAIETDDGRASTASARPPAAAASAAATTLKISLPRQATAPAPRAAGKNTAKPASKAAPKAATKPAPAPAAVELPAAPPASVPTLKLSLKLPPKPAPKAGSKGASSSTPVPSVAPATSASAAATAIAGPSIEAGVAGPVVGGGGEDKAELRAALLAAQQRSLKASEELSAMQAAPPPTNPLLRARQQTQLDRLKRQRQEADMECMELQRKIEGNQDQVAAKAKVRKGKK